HVVARVVVVQQVVAARLAVLDRLVGQLAQVRVDGPDARLARVGTLGVAAARIRDGGAAVAVLGVVVVRARLGVRVLDLPGRWGGCLARRVLVGGGETGAGRDVVG